MNERELAIGGSLAAVTAIVVLCVAWTLIAGAGKLTRIDLPDARRLHTAPTPRGGGLGMPIAITAAAAAYLTLFDRARADLWVCVLGLSLPNGVLGVIDDYWPIRSRVKFGIQFAVAGLFVALGPRVEELVFPPFGTLELGVASYPFTVFWLVWASNVYNFMDGMDGLAAGSGVVFFATLAGLGFWLGGDVTAGWIAVFGGGACVGFLVVNYPPARIFMGDGGALFVGALLGGLAVVISARGTGGTHATAIPFASAVLAMGSFMWDATYTLGMRIVRREKWNLPHKRHLYQRFVTMGWSHGRVRTLFGMLALIGSAGALGMAFGGGLGAAVGMGGSVGAFVSTAVLAERMEGRKRAGVATS